MVSDIAVIGAACVVPGANSLAEFWHLLTSAHCSISSAPKNRWAVERFLRPGDPAPGFSYSFAGGYLDDPYLFDPAPFGLSPREAAQMDPQQRLLLETTWRAFEDAGISPMSVSGHHIGVFVGASMVDHQNAASSDPAAMGSHFMTGNSLSILSNRLSYIFDLRGPSHTVDTACSSSLVAMTQAMADLRDGRIDMAIVGGVNMLLSPAPFIGFSQARMLSPTGRSQPFGAHADGYVRSEGAAVIILRRVEDARASGDRIRSVIVASGVNTDGRTSGISLPSSDGQRSLIDNVYREAGFSPDDLAFVEAHGTGTRVGDPVEARAIGETLGRNRSRKLPIGSVKSNIGHLEAASGLMGLMKSMLALEHRVLPQSLACDPLNPDIDFDGLNLAPAVAPVALSKKTEPLHSGLCNYGFGGVNVHAILRGPEAPRPIGDAGQTPPRLLVVSAATQDALAAQIQTVAAQIEAKTPVAPLAQALGHYAPLFSYRVARPVSSPRLVKDLNDRMTHAHSKAMQGDQVCFVYSGNGTQFLAMGHAAWERDAQLKAEIAAIDRYFEPQSGWSIAATLATGLDEERLRLTSVAQPLIYAIQSAFTSVLAHYGIRPGSVIGHSLGEVAAAEAAGALTREDAVRLIYRRSQYQEQIRGQGRMLVVALDKNGVRERLGRDDGSLLQIAATNGPTSTTLSGPADAIAAFAEACRRDRIPAVDIGLDYPFHSNALDPFQNAIIDTLRDLKPQAERVPFISTVTGERHPGESLNADYWWKNIRQPVLFDHAIRNRLADGVSCFIEIAPRAILHSTMKSIADDHGSDAQIFTTLSANDADHDDPIGEILAGLVEGGIAFDCATIFGSRPDRHLYKPHYPFQRQRYTLPLTAEGLLTFGRMIDETTPQHPLLGARMAAEAPEWRNILDVERVPYLQDHVVNDEIILPAAGFIEMAFAAGRDIFGHGRLRLDVFDVLKPLVLSRQEMREISVRYGAQAHTIEIWSRKRFSTDAWTLHAQGILRGFEHKEPLRIAPPPDEAIENDAEAVYAEARRASIEYGPSFALVEKIRRTWTVCEAHMRPPMGSLGAYADIHAVHPASLDAAFHGLFIQRPQGEGERLTYLPVRFEDVRLYQQGATVTKSISELQYESSRSKTIALTLFDRDENVVLSIGSLVFRVVSLARSDETERMFRETMTQVYEKPSSFLALKAHADPHTADEIHPSWLLMRALTLSLGCQVLSELVEVGSDFDVMDLVMRGKIASASEPVLTRLIAPLVEIGAVEDREGRYRFMGLSDLPDPNEILKRLIEDHPDASFEIRLAAFALSHFRAVLRNGPMIAMPKEMRDRLIASVSLGRATQDWLITSLRSLYKTIGCRLHLLAVTGSMSGLVRALRALEEEGLIYVTYVALDDEIYQTLQSSLGRDGSLDVIMAGDGSALSYRFDAVVGSIEPYLGRDLIAAIQNLVPALFPGAPLIVTRPGSDLFFDALSGLWRPHLTSAGDQDGQLLLPMSAVIDAFQELGLADPIQLDLDPACGSIAHARATQDRMVSEDEIILLTQDRATDYGASQAKRFAADDFDGLLASLNSHQSAEPVILVPLDHYRDASSDTLGHGIEYLKRLFACLLNAGSRARIYLLTQGAHATQEGAVTQSGLRGFIRVAMNEFANLDLRIIDLMDRAASARVMQIVTLGGPEREWVIDRDGLKVIRVRRGLPTSWQGEGEASVLRFAQPGRFETASWILAPRRAPAADEIEIEIDAVGLNFRDVMLGLGVLDDALLSAGLTGATLGFECAGRVTRVGEAVTDLHIGDVVMGFAAHAFASHVTAPAWQFMRVPEGMSAHAAATIPVAFATAWYALIERARLRDGDCVLIHGAAGGVGLAAIQIAKSIGATVIGTASDPARRAIAMAAGADAVFDSRDGRFFDAIMTQYGGVDVALNSLSGENMRATLELMRPFGRFIELGKKDFLDNSLIGLRPFLRNVTYSGVDLDELLRHDRRTVSDMMTKLVAAFEKGTLQPLPYQLFEGHDVASAFRMMQASEHVGKLLVKPSRFARIDLNAAAFQAEAGPWLIVGGTSGFGFKTAMWLARHGATHLILASRRGGVEDNLASEIAHWTKRGVQIETLALDVRDADAVTSCVHDIKTRSGPLRGVIHAAVQLEDGLISGLDPKRVRDVLAAKVDGVIHLERATEGHSLQAFVLYSSATTMIGSPGQGAYVAANAFLEGFARSRRARGRPVLAVGWGAISDAGLIARDQDLAERLRRTTGVAPISSEQALAHLGGLLAAKDAIDPVQIYTNFSTGGAADKLALIKSPTFAPLTREGGSQDDQSEYEFADRVSALPLHEAKIILIDRLRHEAAQIMRMSKDDVDPARALGSIGLDSLMGLELHLAIENLVNVQMPMIGASDKSLNDIAGSILNHISRVEERDAS